MQQPGTGMDLASPPRTPRSSQQLVHRTSCQNVATMHSSQHMPDVPQLPDESMYHCWCTFWHVICYTVTRPCVLWTVTNTTFCVGEWFLSAIAAGLIQVLWNNKWVVAITGGCYMLQAGLPLIWGYLLLQLNLPGVVTSTLIKESLFSLSVPSSTSNSGTWWCMTTFVCHFAINCVSIASSCWHMILQRAHKPFVVDAIRRVLTEKILWVPVLIAEAPELSLLVKEQMARVHQTLYTERDFFNGNLPLDSQVRRATCLQHQTQWVDCIMRKFKGVVPALLLLLVACYFWGPQSPTTVDEWQQHCNIRDMAATLKTMWLSDPDKKQCTNAAWQLFSLLPSRLITAAGIGDYSQTLDNSKANLLVPEASVTTTTQWDVFYYVNIYDYCGSFACMAYHGSKALYWASEGPATNTFVASSYAYNR